MKKPVNFEKAITENKAKYIRLLPFIKSSKKPRSKLRSEEESIGLAIATANAVKMAYKSSRIVKKFPKGFVLNEIKKCLKIENKIERQVAIACIITKALEPFEITPIVVGGTAVEFYTNGQYATMDIDFVAIINDAMEKVLSDLGFEKQGRYWMVPDTDIIIELSSDELVGAKDKIEPVEYKGNVVYFIGLDDIILDRVQAARHWKDLKSTEWARNLMVSRYEEIDWSYCHKKANEYSCLDKFKQIHKEAKKIIMENNL